MHFDIPDLRLFIHVAEANSLTGGARRASLSTAAASMRIKALEGQLGSRLFYRDSQGVELTPAGHDLLVHARAIMRQVDYIKDEFSQYAEGQSGHIRIFANTTAVSDFMPDVLARFLVSRPGVTVDLQERLTNDIVRGVIDGSTDLGVVAGPVTAKKLEIIPFNVDRLVVVTPSDHFLANRKGITFQETLNYPHIGLREGSTLFNFLKGQANEINSQLQMRIQVFGFESACRMVSRGVGIGILPGSIARRYAEFMDISIVALEESWAERERSLIVRELDALPKCGKELVEEIRAQASLTTPPESAG
ncbi:LysR family transcriptional regulator [Marinobacter caseinilyticus]|uniref:LysR family transcriptional regulator n=1 Tax=Marinobacter caseinilyticus TaxID=2692195 RepID=UPI00140A4D60|nr:LysR family transcriptional regulator [Marinobacter caseinilyticus]